MSDNNDDSNDKHDLTRIEDLSEFLHSEDDDDLSDLATDPDIQIPDGFNSQDNQEDSVPDFDALENDSFDDSQTSAPFEENLPQLPDEAQEENTTSFDSPSEFDNSFDNNFEENNDDLNNSFDTTNDFTNEDSSFDSDDNFNHEDTFNNEDDSFISDDNSFDDTDNNFDQAEDSLGQDENSFDSASSFDSDNTDFESSDFNNTEPEEDFDPIIDEQILDEQTLEGSEILNEIIDSTPQNTPEEEEIINQQDSFEDTFEESIKEDTPPVLEEIETSFNEENKTKLPQYEKEDEFKAPENFKQLQQFAKNVSYGNMAKEGNPPFSII